MDKLAARIILQVDLHRVSLADPNKGTGNGIAEGPEFILDAIGQLPALFKGLEPDDYSRGIPACDGRRNLGRWQELRRDPL